MEYFFNIAGITIKIFSEIEICWNQYIQRFRMSPCVRYDEYYECRCVDSFSIEGALVYQNEWQKIYKHGAYEERLHFFWGQKEPCMLYKELPDRKIIYLHNNFRESFLREDNYFIFNAMALEKVLMKHKAIILHSSYIIHKQKAILFTAPSGTGKSTQASLWERYRDAVIVNGDRTILCERDGEVYAYGMPVCGSSDICLNQNAPVHAIIYLSQSPKNEIQQISLKQRIKYLISETTINFFDAEYLNQAIEVLTRIAQKVDMFSFSCTKEKDAVETLGNYLEGDILGSN